MTGKPHVLGYAKKLIPVSQIFSFRARVKIIHDVPSQRPLSARTVGDPQSPQGSVIYPAELRAINEASGFDAIFVGYSSNPAVTLTLRPGNKYNSILRGHHVIIGIFGISYNPAIDKLSPNEVIFQRSFDNCGPRSNASEMTVDWSVEINPSKLESVTSPFVPGDC